MTRKEIRQWAEETANKIFHKKHQKEVTIKGWLARDGDGRLSLFMLTAPVKGKYNWIGPLAKFLPPNSFPSVKWEDKEPTPCTMTIEIEK